MKKDLVEEIQAYFISHHMTLSVAESCTGGNLAASLTAIPGSSKYFLGGVVTYSNEFKIRLLGVDKEIVNFYGAVSAPVVTQMVKGIHELTGSNVSLAITGIAGPTSESATKPVGMMWAAIEWEGKKPLIWDFYLTGSRKEVIDKATEILLRELLLLIKSQ